MFDRDQEAELRLHYQASNDEDLLNLARKTDELNEMARDLLSSELRGRRIDVTEQKASVNSQASQTGIPGTSEGIKVERQIWYARPGDYAELAPQDCVMPIQEGKELHAIRVSLAMADIPYDEFWPTERADLRHPILAVLPEDRERAKAILSKPPTLEATEQIQAEIDDPDDWKVPLCPTCGASDPLLTSVNPVNTWHCEECDQHWNEA